MPVNVLLVEDDDAIRTSLTLALEDAGYVVTPAASAEVALVELGRVDPEVMIVDLFLGPMDGFTFIAQARLHTDSPIIAVGALDQTSDVVRALEVGADDYVATPVEVEELLARLNALQRRARGVGSRIVPMSDPALVVLDEGAALVLDLAAGVVRRGEEDLRLTVTEFRVLAELASPPGHVLSRQVLVDRVWDRGYFGDERVVDVHIRRLRVKVEDDPGSPQLVVTVRGLGYLLDPR